MAKKVFKQAVSNGSAITKGSSWIGAYRFRMADADREKFGPFNFLTVVNESDEDAVIRFGINNEGGAPLRKLPAKSSLNINVEDGVLFYDFDVINEDATTDIGAAEITGFAMVVLTVDEPRAERNLEVNR